MYSAILAPAGSFWHRRSGTLWVTSRDWLGPPPCNATAPMSCGPTPTPAVYERHVPEDTALYQVVQEHWETFRARVEEAGESLPKHVVAEVEGFLRCGVLVHGFVRLYCDACKGCRVLAFSCKGRGLCPSCAGRFMADTAAHIVDKVIRPIPVRQWVLTLPFAIRRWAACRPEVISALNTILVQTVFAWLRSRARDLGIEDGEPGAITFIQRFADGVKLMPHLHVVVSDGVFTRVTAGPARFHAVRAPSQTELEQLVAKVAAKAEKALAKLDRHSNDVPAFTDRCAGVAVQAELSLDDTRRPRKLRGPKPERKLPRLCAEVDGFNLHAAVRIAARSRKALEHLIRYVARPAIADGRLSLGDDGRVHVELKRVWADGTRSVSYDPLTFLERVVALIPPPRVNLVRYAGVWGAHSALRKHVLPSPPPDPPVARLTARAEDCVASRRLRMSWAELLKRVFGVDGLACSRCTKRLRVIGVVYEPTAVEGILAALSLPVTEPPRARARAPPSEDAFDDSNGDPLPSWYGEAA